MKKENEKKERNPDIFERIAELLKKRPSYVKHILGIGKSEPDYLERIEDGRYSVFGAYSKCLEKDKIKSGKQPPPKTPDENPEISLDMTAEPVTQGEPEANEVNADNNVVPPNVTDDDFTTNDEPEKYTLRKMTVESKVIDGVEYLVISGNCECCGEAIEIKLTKNELP